MPVEKAFIKAIIHDNFPDFAELGLQDEMTQVAHYMTCDTGKIFMDFGQYIKSIPIVIKGTMKIMREDEEGNEILLYYLGEGQTCAVSLTCCMMNKRSSIKAIVEEDVECLTIPVKHMDMWMMKYHSWKNFIMRSYNFRFEELLATIDDIAFKKMDERLVSYLIQKAALHNSNIINITHKEISTELNASREAISRLLKKLEIEKKIELGRNKIIIKEIW